MRVPERERADVVAKRIAFSGDIQKIAAQHLVFLDEMGTNLAMTPSRARSLKGTRAICEAPMRRGKNISVIAAVNIDKVLSWYPYDGAVNKERCVCFLKGLSALLSSSSVVVMDNVRFHHSKQVLEVIEDAGAKVLFTAPYHPELNAIEEVFSFVKNLLRKMQARSLSDLVSALQTSFGRLTPRHLKAYVEHVFSFARQYQPL